MTFIIFFFGIRPYVYITNRLLQNLPDWISTQIMFSVDCASHCITVNKRCMQKVVELLCESEKSAEDAARAAITTVSTTLKNVQSLEVRPRPNRLDSAGIVHYRVCARVTYGVGAVR